MPTDDVQFPSYRALTCPFKSRHFWRITLLLVRCSSDVTNDLHESLEKSAQFAQQ